MYSLPEGIIGLLTYYKIGSRLLFPNIIVYMQDFYSSILLSNNEMVKSLFSLKHITVFYPSYNKEIW